MYISQYQQREAAVSAVTAVALSVSLKDWRRRHELSAFAAGFTKKDLDPRKSGSPLFPQDHHDDECDDLRRLISLRNNFH